MNLSKTKHIVTSCEREHGSALLELAIVIPLLVMLAFGIFEISTTIERHQLLSIASREAGNWAIRDCIGLQGAVVVVDIINQDPVLFTPRPSNLNPSLTPTPLEACLIKIVDDIKGQLSSNAFPINITLSVFSLQAGSTTDIERKGRITTLSSPSSILASLYSDARVHNELLSQLNDTDTIILSETFGTANIPFARFINQNGMLYESTVF